MQLIAVSYQLSANLWEEQEACFPARGSNKRLFVAAEEVVELGFVLDLSGDAGFAGHDARRLRLAYSLASVGFDRFDGRGSRWLAFGHDKHEYGIDSAGAEVAARCHGSRAGRQKRRPEGRRQRTSGMDEREFFNETTEQRMHNLTCPKCGQAAEYKVSWVVRRKRQQLPRGADERDRAKFAKAQSYMVRRDDKLQCANIRCRKPFEITTLQSLAFLME